MADQPSVHVGDLGDAPILPILLIAIGGYLAWFGVHYWRSDNVTWPSDPIKSVLQGNGLPQVGSTETALDTLNAVENVTDSSSSGDSGSKSGGGNTNVPTPPKGTANAQKNQNIAKMLCAGYGWAPQQNKAEWDALVDLWNEESGWNQYARNPSGATGIPQALPGSKMASAGPDWETNPATQIKWGLRYIKERYGSPTAAYAFENSHTPHWY